jgi:hypothetical protein
MINNEKSPWHRLALDRQVYATPVRADSTEQRPVHPQVAAVSRGLDIVRRRAVL